MDKTAQKRTIALAGVFQAAYLVDQIATKGVTDSSALESSISSLFKIDAESVEAVFGNINGVVTGLSVINKIFSGSKDKNYSQTTKYVVGILHLERKMNKNIKLTQQIVTGIQLTTSMLDTNAITHINILNQLADLYQNTLATLTPRILVKGDKTILSNTVNAAKVRALLFAGVRAALLWRQCGGVRWQILLSRQAVLKQTSSLLSTLRN